MGWMWWPRRDKNHQLHRRSFSSRLGPLLGQCEYFTGGGTCLRRHHCHHHPEWYFAGGGTFLSIQAWAKELEFVLSSPSSLSWWYWHRHHHHHHSQHHCHRHHHHHHHQQQQHDLIIYIFYSCLQWFWLSPHYSRTSTETTQTVSINNKIKVWLLHQKQFFWKLSVYKYICNTYHLCIFIYI